jgi:hypothetical protein
VKKSPQNVAQSVFFVKSNTQLLQGQKVAQLFVLRLQFSQKLPKVNSHPIGENWPNLVTLLLCPKTN